MDIYSRDWYQHCAKEFMQFIVDYFPLLQKLTFVFGIAEEIKKKLSKQYEIDEQKWLEEEVSWISYLPHRDTQVLLHVIIMRSYGTVMTAEHKSRASYGVCVVRIWEKIDCLIMALHCIILEYSLLMDIHWKYFDMNVWQYSDDTWASGVSDHQ